MILDDEHSRTCWTPPRRLRTDVYRDQEPRQQHVRDEPSNDRDRQRLLHRAPGPRPIANGARPRIVQRLVIRIGRNRVRPALSKHPHEAAFTFGP